MRNTLLTLTALIASSLVACDGSPADPVEPGSPAPPAGCAVEGNYLLGYTPVDAAPPRPSDVLAVSADGVRVDSHAAVEAAATGCDAVTTTARWAAEGCAVTIEHVVGPCGEFEWRSELRATVQLGDAQLGEATVGETAGDVFEEGEARVDVRALADGLLCAPVEARPTIPGFMWSDDFVEGVSGVVEVVEVSGAGDEQRLRLRAADGVEVQAEMAASVWAPAVGETAWLDVAFASPFWTEASYLLYAEADGPLIAGAIYGGSQWLAEGPWADAGVTVGRAPACGAAWLQTGCPTVTELQALTVEGAAGSQTLYVGEAATVELGGLGAVELAIAEAHEIYEVRCTDHPSSWYAVGVVPVD